MRDPLDRRVLLVFQDHQVYKVPQVHLEILVTGDLRDVLDFLVLMGCQVLLVPCLCCRSGLEVMERRVRWSPLRRLRLRPSCPRPGSL